MCPLVVSGLWLCVHVSVVLIVLHEDVLLPQHPQHGHTRAVVTQLVKLKHEVVIMFRYTGSQRDQKMRKCLFGPAAGL